MSNKNPIIFRFILVTLLLILIPRLQADQKWTVDVEGGLVTAGYNDVQVPNPGGTRFTLTDALDVKAKIYYRLRLGYQLGVRHQLSLLFAPLTLKGSGQLNQDLWFDQTLFSAGDDVDGTYKFNSYRLTYRYLLIKKAKFKLWIGFTSKIRDAKISLEIPGKEAKTTDLGYVPLLNLVADWQWSDKLGLFFEADALAAPGGQGRAEDVALAIYYQYCPRTKLRLGYRFVEGGADVEQVYNFAFINYFYLGVQVQF